MRAGWRLAQGAHSGHARGFLRVWPLWERFTAWLWRPQRIPGTPHDLLLVRFTRYHGRPITLPDGVTITRGTLVGELHVQNKALARISGEQSTWDLLRMFAEDMRALAAWSEREDFPRGVDAFYGVTLLGRAAGRLGFTIRARPRSLYAVLDRFFMTGLLALYHPQGVARLASGTTYGAYPQEIWISREQLMRQAGGRRAHPAS
ncbi:MAG TPA: hypothetical protein VF807_02615 [Ktedonobacterales bacterium]